MTIRIKQKLQAAGKAYEAGQLVTVPVEPSTDKQNLLELVGMGFAEEVTPEPEVKDDE